MKFLIVPELGVGKGAEIGREGGEDDGSEVLHEMSMNYSCKMYTPYINEFAQIFCCGLVFLDVQVGRDLGHGLRFRNATLATLSILTLAMTPLLLRCLLGGFYQGSQHRLAQAVPEDFEIGLLCYGNRFGHYVMELRRRRSQILAMRWGMNSVWVTIPRSGGFRRYISILTMMGLRVLLRDWSVG